MIVTELFPEWMAVEYPHIPRPVAVRVGRIGYWPFPFRYNIKTITQADDFLARMHHCRSPTQPQRDAAYVGSLRGWSDPGADPAWWEQMHSRGVREALANAWKQD